MPVQTGYRNIVRNKLAYTAKQSVVRAYVGFSLIELLITLSVLSIIVLLSVGRFTEHRISVNRKNAQMHLLAFTQKLHQYHHQHYSYAGASLALYADFLPPDSSAANADYRLNLDITDKDQGFLISAEPINSMSGTGKLTINHYGDKRWYETNATDSNTFRYW